MGTHFSGQPLHSQVIKLLDKSKILRIIREKNGERYIKCWMDTLGCDAMCSFEFYRTVIKFYSICIKYSFVCLSLYYT